jgi:glycine/D-amino acid oxidase-like deaminating enzyme
MTVEPWPRAVETDVLVVGGGIFGAATAYHLARFGVDMVLVDRADPGAEASGGNAGSLHLQTSPSYLAGKSEEFRQGFAATLPFFVAAVEHWKALARELPRDIELTVKGGLMVAETEAQMRALHDKVETERAHGLDIHMLTVNDVRREAPYLGDAVIGAAFCPGEGKANPLAAVAGLLDGARSAGGRVMAQTEVTGIQSASHGWRVSTSRGAISCRRLVIAAGLWSEGLAAKLGVALPITHRPIHVNVTETCRPFIGHLVQHAELRLTLKQVRAGNVIVGGGWPATLDPEFARPAVLRESIQNSLWLAQHIVPKVGGLNLLRCWASRNAYTPDGKPILGPHPGAAGLYFAVCNTFGFTLGPLCGLLVAEAVTARHASLDLTPYSIARFARQSLIHRD